MPIAVYLGILALATTSTTVWFPIVFVLVAVSVVDGLTELLLRPYISGRNLHVGLVLFAYILGLLVFGWYGLFLGPLLLVLIVHLARIVLPELVHGESVRPDAEPIPSRTPTQRTRLLTRRLSQLPPRRTTTRHQTTAKRLTVINERRQLTGIRFLT